jgi:transposase
MDMNAAFPLDTYVAALKWADSSDVFRNKKIVLVIDNAPAHERSEHRPPLPAHRLAILRLAPYSPTCNPIDGCFSVLKAAVKRFVSANIARLKFLRRG